MRIDLILLCGALACSGCQTAARRSVPPPAIPPLPPAPSLEAQEKALRQQQHIQALIAQNDALHTRVRELETPRVDPPLVPLSPPVAVVEPVSPLPEVSPAATAPLESESVSAAPTVPSPAVSVPVEPAILPNADGLIDLVALFAPAKDGDDVNPFAVRSLPAEAVREITLHVQGAIGGAAPCALINHRAVLPGENVETLAVTTIESDAVLIRHAGRLLRLPVAEKPVRIRLPL